MTSDRVKKMSMNEVDWWLKRLNKQFKDENKEITSAMSKAKKQRSTRFKYGV